MTNEPAGKRADAAIIGARAYTAAALIECIRRHSSLRVATLQARVDAPEPISTTFPQFLGDASLPDVTPVDPDAVPDGTAVVFLCLPHTTAAEHAKALMNRGMLVVDLSADFRFSNVAEYERVYGVTHPAPELVDDAVYGLAELNRAMLRTAKLIGCAGCYPTAVTLALAPLMRRELASGHSVIADCKSGVSGAGRTPTDTTHFCHAAENFAPYKVAAHRHQPEMEEQLSRITGRRMTVTFVPHLVPMTRGILATCYVNLTEPIAAGNLQRLYEEFYNDEPFVRILPPGRLPQTSAVARTNFCDIALTVDEHAQRLIVTSAIDNLVKGAAGQAVQCYNIASGGRETDGLL